jgi:hypothetical protein
VRRSCTVSDISSHVMIVDDDCIPGPRFVELAMHTMNIPKYRGLLGVKGHIADAPDLAGQRMFFFGPLGRTEYLVHVDLVGGAWIAETSWVKYAFREDLWTQETGEDYYWSYSLAKHLELRSFVLPVDLERPEFNGFSEDYLDISNAGDSTLSSAWRPMLSQHLWNRGTVRTRSHLEWDNRLRILAFIPSKESLELLSLAIGPVKSKCDSSRMILAFTSPVSALVPLDLGNFLDETDSSKAAFDCFEGQRRDYGSIEGSSFTRIASTCASSLARAWKPGISIVFWGESALSQRIAAHISLALRERESTIVNVGSPPDNGLADVVAALSQANCHDDRTCRSLFAKLSIC